MIRWMNCENYGVDNFTNFPLEIKVLIIRFIFTRKKVITLVSKDDSHSYVVWGER